MGRLGMRTGSLCCWLPWGTPVLAGALQRDQTRPSVPPNCGGHDARAGSWAGPCHLLWLQGYLRNGRCGGMHQPHSWVLWWVWGHCH